MGCKGSSVRITPSRPKNPRKSSHLAVTGFFYALCFLFVGQIYPTFYPTRVFAASQLGNGAACTLIFVRFQILLPEQFSERRMSLLPGELVAVDICFFCHPKSLVQSALSSTTTVRVHQHDRRSDPGRFHPRPPGAQRLQDQPQGRIDAQTGEEIDDVGHLRITMPSLRRCAPTACPNDRGTSGQMYVECPAG